MKTLELELGTDYSNLEETEGELSIVVRTIVMLRILGKYDAFHQLGQVALNKDVYVFKSLKIQTHDELLDTWVVCLKLLKEVEQTI